jgi:hypothetical protein
MCPCAWCEGACGKWNINPLILHVGTRLSEWSALLLTALPPYIVLLLLLLLLLVIIFEKFSKFAVGMQRNLVM